MTEWRIYGCGSASSNVSLQTSYEVIEKGVRLQIDFGNGAMYRRCQCEGRITRVLDSIEHIFLTHSHADHIADLTRHAVAWKYTPGYTPSRPTHLYGTAETLGIVQRMIDGMNMNDLFDEAYILHEFDIGDEFTINEFEIYIYPAQHIPGSCGVRIHTPNQRKIHFTGDTTYFNTLWEHFQNVDLLVIETCFYEMEHIMHLNLEQVAELAAQAQPQAILLVHLYPELEELGAKRLKKEIARYYQGKVYVAQDGVVLKWDKKKCAWRKKQLF